VHGVAQVVHADRGTSMTSKTVAGLLADLEVTRSHSRHHMGRGSPLQVTLTLSAGSSDAAGRRRADCA
jgi:putative transposase